MLEDIAHSYISLDESAMRGVNVLGAIAGAIVAGMMNHSRSEIQRAPYFALWSLLFFAVSATQITWLWAIPAMSGGYLALFMSIDLLSSFAAGIVLCQLAMARARDATGRSGYAAFAFVPLANFFLVFGRSAKVESQNRKALPALLQGFPGVVVGIVAFGAAFIMTTAIQEIQKEQVAKADAHPLAQQAAIESMLRTQGLSGALKTIAMQAGLPVSVDNATTLTRIEADGSQLRRTFVVNASNVTMTNDMRERIQNNICAYPTFAALLRQGASLREVYIKSDGTPIGAHMITRDLCGL